MSDGLDSTNNRFEKLASDCQAYLKAKEFGKQKVLKANQEKEEFHERLLKANELKQELLEENAELKTKMEQ